MIQKRHFAILLLAVIGAAGALTASAQQTIESIRKEYKAMHDMIVLMTPDEDGETALPPEYFDLNVVQNLPGTGPHRETIRMFYGEKETDDDDVIYPPHYLRFVTAKYNFAAREFYEEYLYDEKGQVMFIYALTPDVGEDLVPQELRMWFDGKRLLRFSSGSYSGTTIPEIYRRETDRCRQRAQRFLLMFSGIDENTYL